MEFFTCNEDYGRERESGGNVHSWIPMAKCLEMNCNFFKLTLHL